MYRKIILFMLWASVAVGQSTSQYQIVVYNGDGAHATFVNFHMGANKIDN